LNPEVHHHVHRSPQLVPILSQMNPVHSLHSIPLRLIPIPSYDLCLGLLSGLYPSDTPTKILFAFLKNNRYSKKVLSFTLLPFHSVSTIIRILEAIVHILRIRQIIQYSQVSV